MQLNINKWVLLVVFCICFLSSLAFAGEFSDVNINEAFKKLLINDDFLMDGGVAVKEDARNRYIIAVGSTINKEKEAGADAFLRMQSFQVAEVKAKKLLADFIYGIQHESETYFEKKTRVKITTVTENGEEKELKNVEQEKEYLNTITEKVGGVLSANKRVGQWYSKDREMVYVAVLIVIPK